ncbi:MAG: hypothetical protein UZ01_01394 [Candidatus Brocadia sinica]|nr:MAG: hypothetical protein UZ01_01394 [Candidatus Brocadia sinica]
MNESYKIKEPPLEPLLRWMRIRRVRTVIRQYEKCKILDIGCGYDFKLLRTLEPYIEHGFGIDFKANDLESPKITIRKILLYEKLPFDNEIFDVVTMLAVLEHLNKPVEIIKEIERVLAPDGKLILTVPSKISKPVLEFLSYKLGIINKEEIKDHKKYYDLNELKLLFGKTNLVIEKHKYFQFGMNNFCVARLK